MKTASAIRIIPILTVMLLVAVLMSSTACWGTSAYTYNPLTGWEPAPGPADYLPSFLTDPVAASERTLRESIAWYLRWMTVILIVPMPFLCVFGWCRYYGRHNRINYPRRRGRVTQLPRDVPAPVILVLKNREVTARTLLTIVLDMCNKGTLELHAAKQGQ